ncbi:type II toxin-antitoxin system VapC family toxin [Neorhizobium lilium]|uniref:Type II toxin-antitoxin system VapC family toxin n=1 Tax=Neorhizobium lilium TaxID=2503024 RepID=A0A444LI74_9HYPH|nr:type II toxin-antitoxin system VapC family toxin [Neorhizobium lilium]RWX78607.1 type II toxin-antitoxin system VapC family toxin [Neorhizobium lilium]
MRCLLDTHMIIAVLRNDIHIRFPEAAKLVVSEDFSGFASVASLWEIAIKSRLGKLDPGMDLAAMQSALERTGLITLSIEVSHVTTVIKPEPPTRDPFDRLLLAQCHVEGLQLVTVDRALVDHPLAFRL